MRAKFCAVAGAIAVMLCASAAEAQRSSRCSAEVTRVYGKRDASAIITGILCGSREAAIAAEFHYRNPDEKVLDYFGLPSNARVSRAKVVEYINNFRNETNACIYIDDGHEGVTIKKLYDHVHPDAAGDGKRMVVRLWDVKGTHEGQNFNGTLMTAHYDDCR